MAVNNIKTLQHLISPQGHLCAHLPPPGSLIGPRPVGQQHNAQPPQQLYAPRRCLHLTSPRLTSITKTPYRSFLQGGLSSNPATPLAGIRLSKRTSFIIPSYPFLVCAIRATNLSGEVSLSYPFTATSKSNGFSNPSISRLQPRHSTPAVRTRCQNDAGASIPRTESHWSTARTICLDAFPALLTHS